MNEHIPLEYVELVNSLSPSELAIFDELVNRFMSHDLLSEDQVIENACIRIQRRRNGRE